jgi:hypothetical protein
MTNNEQAETVGILTPDGEISMDHVRQQFDAVLQEILDESNKSKLDHVVEKIFFID